MIKRPSKFMSQEKFWDLIAKKLAGEASDEELRELETLMRQHPEWQYAVQNMQDIWNLQAGPAHDNELSFQYHLQRMANAGIQMEALEESDDEGMVFSRKKYLRKTAWYVAAALLIACMVMIGKKSFVHNNEKLAHTQPPPNSEISTKIGSRSKLVLPDGSTVWLNAGSKLTYNKSYDTDLREVTLSGEAFFDVLKIDDRPFVIHTATIDITVLGTSFNVKSYPDESTTETSLIKGKVSIVIHSRPSEKIILQPDEKLIVNNNDSAYKTSHNAQAPLVAIENVKRLNDDSTIVETSWVNNKLVFSNTSFDDIVRQMQRWYGVSIDLKNEQLKQSHFTGTFEHETIVQALEAMKITTPFHYTITDNTKIVITP